RELGDADAAVGLREDEPLALEEAQRLAERRPADAELLREGDLGRRLAGRDLPAQDRVPQPVVDDADILAVSGARAHGVHRLPRLRLNVDLDTVAAFVARRSATRASKGGERATEPISTVSVEGAGRVARA